MTFAYSGDPDDVFAFYGLSCGAVRVPGNRASRHVTATIQELNEWAIRGRHEVSAISSAAYPFMADRYFISGAGTSVGRNYGPVLASKRFANVESLRGRTVASPGPLTTGHLLMKSILPDCATLFMPFDRIRAAIESGAVDAGVLIHEEILNYKRAGLVKVACLGEVWQERTGLPLPVGLNVVRRNLGEPLARRVVAAMRASIRYGLAHAADAARAAHLHSIALEPSIADDFVAKFVNDDAIEMDAELRRGLRALMDLSCEINGLAVLDRIDVL